MARSVQRPTRRRSDSSDSRREVGASRRGPRSTSPVLSRRQIERYARDGILFPIEALSPHEVSYFRAAFDDVRARLRGISEPQQPHLHFRAAYDLATHDTVLDTVEQLLGPDILVHSSTIFCKRPGDGAYVSWHQDGYNLGLNQPDLLSIWIALSDSVPQNGCLRVLPGSHSRQLRHTFAAVSRYNLLKTGLVVSEDVDDRRARNVILRAGQMSLHHVNLLHGSEPNRSGGERIGFAIRYIAPHVKQTAWHYQVLLARGEYAEHHYDVVRHPPADSIEDGVDSQVAFNRWLRDVRDSGSRTGAR